MSFLSRLFKNRKKRPDASDNGAAEVDPKAETKKIGRVKTEEPKKDPGEETQLLQTVQENSASVRKKIRKCDHVLTQKISETELKRQKAAEEGS